MTIDTTDLPMASAAEHGLAHRRTSRQANRHAAVTVYAVSKISLDPEGRVTEVLWGQVDTVRNDWSTDEATAPVREVVDAIHGGAAVYALFPSATGHVPERRFDVIEHEDGTETIAIGASPDTSRGLGDMDRMADGTIVD